MRHDLIKIRGTRLLMLRYSYPGPTLRALELLQQEQFRKDILMPGVVHRMMEEGLKATTGDRP